MKYKVTAKQKISDTCFICGDKNDAGLHAAFYELENGECACVFNAPERLNSYKDRMHGGVVSAILDETIGRAALIKYPDYFAFTMQLDVKFRRPVILNADVVCLGRITNDTENYFTGVGEIYCGGKVLASAEGKYKKVFDFPDEKLHEDKIHPDLEYIEI